jgi:hypothetical protein
MAHVLRPLLTTRLMERDQLAVAPEIERLFEQDLARRGAAAASVSHRVEEQIERVEA